MYEKVNHPERACKYCNEVFKPTRIDKQFCSSKCRKLFGKKYLKHSKGNKQTIKKYLKERRRPYAKYKQATCERCGFIPEHLCQLDVDHIDGNHHNNDPNNLQTLCSNCHRLKTARQLGWA